MRHAHGPARAALPIAEGREGDRVTTLELLFDLVYAFAFTQVTSLMSHESAPGSLIDGYIVLSLLWFSWCAFSWLANQAHADEGILRGVFAVAMTAAFLLSLAVPHAFRDVPGAVTVVACYAAVRLTHASAYLLAARKDRGLRRQIVVTVVVSLVPTLVLLGAGAALAQPAQRWFWLAAVVYDFASVYVSGKRVGGWRILSAAHFSERYSLIVILALGESVVAIGAGERGGSLGAGLAAGAVFALLLVLGLWAAYFRGTLPVLEKSLAAAAGRERSSFGQDVFTFLHFVVIAGIIVTAFGIRVAMERLGAASVGPLGGWSLGAGAALFLAGTVASVWRADGRRLTARIPAIVALAGLSPLIAVSPSVLAVAVVAALVLFLAVFEGVRSNRRRTRLG